MKAYRYLGGCSFAFVLLASTAGQSAVPLGDVSTYEITRSGTYALTIAGAQGGADANMPTIGGGGAVISGDVYLSSGTILEILVGQAGSQKGGDGGSGGSGGGMSFVAIGTDPLIVAGGGGGSMWFSGAGGPGLIGTSGGGINPGANGQGAPGPGGGAGWYSDGNLGMGASQAFGGGGHTGPTWAGGEGYIGGPGGPFAYVDGPGADGGFGGGGGASYSCGGGGGGYSGGSGGSPDANPFGTACEAGGGGGSYISPLIYNVVALEGANIGPIVPLLPGFPDLHSEYVLDGFVTISAVPEPRTWAMLLFGFAAIGIMLRHKKDKGVDVSIYSPRLRGCGTFRRLASKR